jgi:TusA-related sulfurtransferase
MKAPNAVIHTVDVRGLFGPEALLMVEDAAAGLPGEVVEVLSDDPCFAADLVRWCGDGYGLILETSYGSEGDRFRWPCRPVKRAAIKRRRLAPWRPEVPPCRPRQEPP